MEYISQLKKYYPESVRIDKLMNVVEYLLLKFGNDEKNLLFGNSTCPDEVNNLILSLAERWGENFSLGGLAGFPFTGISGFKAYSSHAPDNGSLFILYASHIGINKSGELGKILRRGMVDETVCCGSATAALMNIQNNTMTDLKNDGQQHQVENYLMKHIDSIDELYKLPGFIFQEIDDTIRELITVEKMKKVYLLGGIQINTHFEDLDYFVPLVFEIYSPGKGYVDHLSELREMLDYH